MTAHKKLEQQKKIIRNKRIHRLPHLTFVTSSGCQKSIIKHNYRKI